MITNPLLLLLSLGLAAPQEDTCLLFAANCLAKGEDNFFLYQVFSERPLQIKEGDRLAYEIFLPPSTFPPRGGVDITFDEGCLRDSGARDQMEIRAHGDALLPAAVGRWLERRIDLSHLAGRTVASFDLQAEGDECGAHAQFIDNVRILHGDGAETAIYRDGPPEANRVHFLTGYSERAVLQPIARARVTKEADFAALLDEAGQRQQIHWQYQRLEEDVRLAEAFLEADGRGDLVAQTREVLGLVPAPDAFSGSPAEYAALVHETLHRFDHAHAVMQAYTGHLVGHAHIDFQWLWEWPEGVEVTRQTFAQACRFMEEFAPFTFTQSSAALYAAIEEHFPDLFAEVRRRVAEGRFEIAGGRWCEGDTNMISGESHARHFLHAQRYFREKFGRTATVGWEPDTFGHVWTLPQMLRLAGIESYYFSRAGKGIPLFWWEGPDGSRVLAFDEPATGSWYNSGIGESQIEELLSFRRATGLRDLMWVYGVGNHGGGPTREQILTALGWQGERARPAVRFATAGAFFARLREQNLSAIPVVKDELNFVFSGCYTTHGDVKRLNRDAEAALVAAETAALLAADTGCPAPRADLARAWKDVLFNHHHDTLPGTSIHPSYEYTRLLLRGAIERARWIEAAALRHVALRVEDPGDGSGVLVFNPLGFARRGLVAVDLGEDETEAWPALAGPGGALAPAQLVSGADGGRKLLFLAEDVPAFGHDVWRAAAEAPAADLSVLENENEIVLRNSALEAHVDRGSGEVVRLVDRAREREVLAGGRRGNVLEAFMEKPHEMSAWVIGEIGEVLPVETEEGAIVIESGPVRAAVKVVRRFRGSRITQWIRLCAGARQLDFETLIDWREQGGAEQPAPMLRVGFPLAAGEFEARYSLPFGDKARPADGAEVPALTWAALVGPQGGAALLNDCKHGHGATTEGVLRLTLARSSYSPDPLPDQYAQRVIFSLFPLGPDTAAVEATRAGFELNAPLVAQRVSRSAINPFVGDEERADLPARRSLATLIGLDSVIPTCLKPSEEGAGVILRLYEAGGTPARGHVILGFPAATVEAVNLIEDPLGDKEEVVGGEVSVTLRPYEILTLRFD
ncbi:MAG: alpha-mannosidase [Planctomycetes bacterium]|nr:alpha-mannosidase [Planctomycetota bacterium]